MKKLTLSLLTKSTAELGTSSSNIDSSIKIKRFNQAGYDKKKINLTYQSQMALMAHYSS